MARFLFATQPITGHVVPALSMVGELVARGHEVRWYVGEKFRSKVEATGARFEGYREAKDYDDKDYDAAFPGRSALKGLDQIRFDFVNLFAKQIGPQHRDLQALVKDWAPDVTVGDPSVFATFTLHELGGPPNAVYNITCLGISGGSVAPFGLGLMPNGSPVGRARNRALEFLAPNVVFRKVSQEIARQCEAIGARPRKFRGVLLSPYLFIQPTTEGFEYPRPDLPLQVHFVGALLPDPPDGFERPAWWGEVEARDRPVVLVTQGTVANDPAELIGPALRGLAGRDVLVIAAGVADPSRLGPAEVPANARVERFVPFKPLMPLIDVYVTNGGFGGVQFALANGVPVVAGGTTEDKPEIGNRVAFSGAGINLKTKRPRPEPVAEAVDRLLADDCYRAAARRLQAELSAHDAPREAADLLESLATTAVPVLRPA